MDYPIIYDKLTENPSGFLGYGLAIVENAKDICITEVLNGEYTLSFALPISDPKWQFIVEENFVKMEGQLFVIRNVSDSHGTDELCTVNCEHVFFLLLDEYIEWLEIVEETSPNTVLNSLLDETEFTVGNIDIATTNPDIVIIENQNPVAAINNVINIWGGEIKVDNWSVGLLTHRGSTAPNIQFRYRKNMKNIKRTVDSSSLVTRLYAYGNDGLTIEDAVENTSSLKYIDSQYINAYRRPKKGTVNFDTGDPDELYTKALKYLTKAEIPNISYEVDVIELKKLTEYGALEEFALGDEVMVIDSELGIDVQARILEYERYPLEPARSRVVLANFRPRIEHPLSELRDFKNQIVTDDGGVKVKTAWFEGVINTLQNQLLASGAYATAQVIEGKGLLFENTDISSVDYGAMYIGPGIFAIAKEKTGSPPSWNWRTFGTGSGFTGDLILANSIKAGSLKVDEALITLLNAQKIIAGSVKAEDIDTTTAKIQTAQIEELVVGGNVAMGENATISWAKVTDTQYVALMEDIANFVTTGEMGAALTGMLTSDNFDTIITKEFIASMNLLVGDQILMGPNAVITWANLSAETQANLVGPQGPQGPQGAQGPAGSNANVPNWVTAWNSGTTLVTSGYICSPKMFIGEGGQLATGMKIDENGINSYANDSLHGWRLDNGNFSDLLVYYYGELRGTIQQSAGNFAIYPGTNSIMILGKPGKTTRAKGVWDFTDATSVAFGSGTSITAKAVFS